MTRTAPSSEPPDTIGVRAPQALVTRLDELAKLMSTPWHKASRSEAIRAALERGVEAMEREVGRKP